MDIVDLHLSLKVASKMESEQMSSLFLLQFSSFCPYDITHNKCLNPCLSFKVASKRESEQISSHQPQMTGKARISATSSKATFTKVITKIIIKVINIVIK